LSFFSYADSISLTGFANVTTLLYPRPSSLRITDDTLPWAGHLSGGSQPLGHLVELASRQCGGEIGGGNGKLTLAAAHRVGSSGKVYSTELDAKALAQLEELAAKEGNITTVKAAEADTNLSPGCCDSIFMRLVYHHLTRPAKVDVSLFRSLKPGGQLAVIDEDPYKGTSVPEGVPKNRGGHGVPQKILMMNSLPPDSRWRPFLTIGPVAMRFTKFIALCSASLNLSV